MENGGALNALAVPQGHSVAGKHPSEKPPPSPLFGAIPFIPISSAIVLKLSMLISGMIILQAPDLQPRGDFFGRDYKPTFEKIGGVDPASPYVNVRIHATGWDALPPHLDGYRVPVAGAIVAVLVQPVQAIAHEVGVEADPDLPIGSPLLPDPVKHGAEATLTAAWGIGQGSKAGKYELPDTLENRLSNGMAWLFLLDTVNCIAL